MPESACPSEGDVTKGLAHVREMDSSRPSDSAGAGLYSQQEHQNHSDHDNDKSDPRDCWNVEKKASDTSEKHHAEKESQDDGYVAAHANE